MKSLSNRQVGALRHVKEHGALTLDDLRTVSQLTLWSLAYRGLVKRLGQSVLLTNEGKEAVMRYDSHQFPTRQHEADLSERVQVLLALVRRRKGQR
jgi:hypothetical protein